MSWSTETEFDVTKRLLKRAKQYDRQFQTASELLSVAVKGAMPWAASVVRGRHVPVSVLETLCAQLLTIVLASEADDSEPRQ